MDLPVTGALKDSIILFPAAVEHVLPLCHHAFSVDQQVFVTSAFKDIIYHQCLEVTVYVVLLIFQLNAAPLI